MMKGVHHFHITMMKGVHHFLVISALLALGCSLVSAYDPSPLQDFCVAINDTKSAVLVNGKLCKDPKLVTPDDFSYSGMNIPRSINNPFGSNVDLLTVDKIAGINTLGISLARVDFAPNGLNPPHIHPRASELLIVVKGTLYAGFITANPDHRLVTKVLHPGDVFVFPFGLIHFQLNLRNTSALAFASLTSQNPGVITIANTIFGSNSSINPDVLTKAFQLDKKVVDYLQKLHWVDNM